jgi:hypothetical protein
MTWSPISTLHLVFIFKKVPMKTSTLFFWFSGLSLGLAACAIFSCPHAQIAVPFMMLLSGATGFLGFKKAP